jgi:hypothetical protein
VPKNPLAHSNALGSPPEPNDTKLSQFAKVVNHDARARTTRISSKKLCHLETENPLRGIERGEELEIVRTSTRSVTGARLVRNARS